MKIKRLEHVAIAVHDMDKSKQMLENLFGFMVGDSDVAIGEMPSA